MDHSNDKIKDSSEDIKKSKLLSYVLRHNPDKFNLILDNNGWTDVQFLLKQTKLSFEQLEEIVKNNDKKRFAFNEDKTRIRASQGHSIDIDLNLNSIVPPDQLYHGTPAKNIDLIIKSGGLSKMNRNHVHLSVDRETAIKVGSRGAKNINIMTINSKLMNFDGYKFYKSDNGVYLTEEVPWKYVLGYIDMFI